MTTQPAGEPTTDAADVEKRVEALILERLYLEVPARDTDLFATGLVDSLGFVELLLGLRQDLGVEVDVDSIDIVEMSSVERISQYIIRTTAADGQR